MSPDTAGRLGRIIACTGFVSCRRLLSGGAASGPAKRVELPDPCDVATTVEGRRQPQNDNGQQLILWHKALPQ